jgi:hypothetical protein
MTEREIAYIAKQVEAIEAILADNPLRAALVLRSVMARRLCSVCPEKVLSLPSPAPLCVEPLQAVA